MYLQCNVRNWMVGLVALAAFVISGQSVAQRDPANRDEDISGTEIDVRYHQRSDGLWVYEYSTTAPESNLGRVTHFYINLECNTDFPDVPLPHPPSDAEGYEGIDNSEPITPVAVQADWGAAAFYGVIGSNEAFWSIALPPGESRAYNRLISPAAPGLRQYELTPQFHIRGWDYPPNHDPTLPKAEDFIVHGLIAGPGCPGEVPPVEQPRFDGTPHPTERSDDLNELLTYAAPLKDRVRVERGTKEVELVIHYGDELDAKSFKVQPGWARRFFNPEPGTQETVQLPLKKNKERHRFFFEAHMEKSSSPGQEKDKKTPPGHALKDRDEFEFREE